MMAVGYIGRRVLWLRLSGRGNGEWLRGGCGENGDDRD